MDTVINYKGCINMYQCTHGHQTITVDREEGTTPAIITCRHEDSAGHRDCGLSAHSSCYRVEQTLLPTHEWYKPSESEIDYLKFPVVEHVKHGGLLLRKIVIAKPA